MKATTFGKFLVAGTLSWGTLFQSLWADGPADLEALAEKAKAAAEGAAEAVEETAEKVEEAAVKAGEKVVEAAVDIAEAAPVDLEKRAEKLGLISSLSADVSAVTTLTNGERIWEEVSESGLGTILMDVFAENDVDLTDPDSPGAQFAALFAEEFLIAVGEGTPKQFENLLALNSLSEKYQTALMVNLWTMGLEDGGMALDPNPFSSLGAAVAENPDVLVNLVAASQMPPILLAARISDDAKRDGFAAALEMGAGMALQMGAEEMPFLEGEETEVAGITFSGLAVDGEMLIETLEEEMGLGAMLENVLDPASAQDVVNSLAKKNLVLLGGVSDEAIYLYLGSSAQELPLVKNAVESLAASEDFAFVDSYLEEEFVNVFWMEEELVKVGASEQRIFGDYIEGIRLALEDNEALGDTKALESKLDKLQKLEESYLAASKSQAAAAVSFLKGDGLYTEGYGGYLDGQYDWDSQFQLGTPEDETFLTIQGVMDVETAQVSMQYLEALFAVVYESAGLMGDLEDVPVDFEEFLEGFALFDEMMKDDALALWKGLRASEAGMGGEYFFEVDLKGSWPTVPNVPEAIIEKGLAPRISYVAPVTDRAALAASWEDIEGAATKLLKTAGELAGEKIPMQKPMSSENNGLKTWFFPIPMQTDDFVPSITLDDEVFVMGTSKERAVALAQAAKKKGEGQTGSLTVMNFGPLREFLANWMSLVEENPEEILVDEDALEFFEENQETLQEALEAMKEFDSWTLHTRIEDGELRTSSHFKTK